MFVSYYPCYIVLALKKYYFFQHRMFLSLLVSVDYYFNVWINYRSNFESINSNNSSHPSQMNQFYNSMQCRESQSSCLQLFLALFFCINILYLLIRLSKYKLPLTVLNCVLTAMSFMQMFCNMFSFQTLCVFYVLNI